MTSALLTQFKYV